MEDKTREGRRISMGNEEVVSVLHVVGNKNF